MKKFKSGFTLAEVLITLSIIGIIAAIVMPALISSYQYRTVGVKLSKFLSTTEDAARAYIVSNDVFSQADNGVGIERFIADTFMSTSIVGTRTNTDIINKLYGESADVNDFPNLFTLDSVTKDDSEIFTIASVAKNSADSESTGWDNQPFAILKDGTRVAFYMLTPATGTNTLDDNWGDGNNRLPVPNVSQIGEPVFAMVFDPHATGLPKNVRHKFLFTVTELGFVFPMWNDGCLWAIANNNYATNSAMFTQGAACGPDSDANNEPENPNP